MKKALSKNRIIAGLFLILVMFIGHAQTSKELFERGNDQYNQGNYLEAITAYESILETKVHSSELYFNLANAYYKSNQVAPSIFYYEKALKLAPNDKEIKNNLSYARNMTIDAIEVVPEVGFTRLSKSVVSSFGYESWALFSVGLMILFVIFFLQYYFSYHTNKKRLLFLTSFASLFLALICLSLAFKRFDVDKKDNPAIVFAQKTEVRTDPNFRSETAFELHEGTKVQVLEAYNEDWARIRLADGKTGWIALTDIKLLNLF